MVDYKEMYLKLFRATAEAIHILGEAQLDCEDLFIRGTEPEDAIVPLPSADESSAK